MKVLNISKVMIIYESLKLKGRTADFNDENIYYSVRQAFFAF